MYEVAKSVRLSKKLFTVYFLNVLDWVCTIYFLSTGLFIEANPIARTFISSVTLGFIIKCIIPFVAVFLCSKYMHLLDFSQLKKADMLISFALTVYFAITLDHIINFIILILI